MGLYTCWSMSALRVLNTLFLQRYENVGLGCITRCGTPNAEAVVESQSLSPRRGSSYLVFWKILKKKKKIKLVHNYKLHSFPSRILWQNHVIGLLWSLHLSWFALYHSPTTYHYFITLYRLIICNWQIFLSAFLFYVAPSSNAKSSSWHIKCNSVLPLNIKISLPTLI